MSEIILREPTVNDIPFLFNTWFRQVWHTVRKGHVSFESFAETQRAAMHLLTDTSTGHIACFDSVPDEILGYVLFQPGQLHYIYVKSDYRRRGIGRLLLSKITEPIKTLSYKGKSSGRKFLEVLCPEAQYDSHYIPGLLARAAKGGLSIPYSDWGVSPNVASSLF